MKELSLKKEKTLWIVFDLETTGLNIYHDSIIQICMNFYEYFEDEWTLIKNYESFVKTDHEISSYVRQLTQIKKEDIESAPLFDDVCGDLFEILQSVNIENVFFLAHNAFEFDMPFFCTKLWQSEREIINHFMNSTRNYFVVDSLAIARLLQEKTLLKCENLKLKTIYDHLFPSKNTIEISWHNAKEDCEALYQIWKTSLFKEYQFHNIVKIKDIILSTKPVQIENLNPFVLSTIKWTIEQKRIIASSKASHLCILAGAGCAKTTTIIGRIMNLVYQGVDPKFIYLTTFSKMAAEDMQKRLNHWANGHVPIHCSTLDSFARTIVKEMNYEEFQDIVDFREYKHMLIQLLENENDPMRKFITKRIKYFFVDEAQDLTCTFIEFIFLLKKYGTIVTFVGDDNQNIFRFNSSTNQYLLEFPKYFNPCKVLQLTNNFRSTKEILMVANESIARNCSSIHKKITSDLKEKHSIPTVNFFSSEESQSQFVVQKIKEAQLNYKTIAILGRNMRQLYEIERILCSYQIANKVIKSDSLEIEDAVTLCTIHKAKGKEWDVVFFITCDDNTIPGIPYNLSQKEENDHIEDERRLFYVACTRAKKQLYFSFFGNQNCHISRFLSEIPRKLFEWKDVTHIHFCISNDFKKKRIINDVDSIISNMNEISVFHLQSLFEDLFRSFQKFEEKSIHSELQFPDWTMTKHLTHNVHETFIHLIFKKTKDYSRHLKSSQYFATFILNNYQRNIFEKHKQRFVFFSNYVKHNRMISMDSYEISKVITGTTTNFIENDCYGQDTFFFPFEEHEWDPYIKLLSQLFDLYIDLQLSELSEIKILYKKRKKDEMMEAILYENYQTFKNDFSRTTDLVKSAYLMTFLKNYISGKHINLSSIEQNANDLESLFHVIQRRFIPYFNSLLLDDNIEVEFDFELSMPSFEQIKCYIPCYFNESVFLFERSSIYSSSKKNNISSETYIKILCIIICLQAHQRPINTIYVYFMEKGIVHTFQNIVVPETFWEILSNSLTRTDCNNFVYSSVIDKTKTEISKKSKKSPSPTSYCKIDTIPYSDTEVSEMKIENKKTWS
jgi:DNA polymerase III epsilon subunit-like protein